MPSASAVVKVKLNGARRLGCAGIVPGGAAVAAVFKLNSGQAAAAFLEAVADSVGLLLFVSVPLAGAVIATVGATTVAGVGASRKDVIVEGSLPPSLSVASLSGGVGKVTGEVGGGYRVSPRIAGQRSGVEDRRGALEGRAVVVVVAIEEAHADRGQSAAAVSCAEPVKVPAQLSGPAVKSPGSATDVVVTLSFSERQRGTGQHEVGAARDAPTLEAQGALL